MHISLQEYGVGIQRERSTEPSEVRGLLFSPWSLPQLGHSLEALLAERGPDAPHERAWSVYNGNLQATSDEELVLVNHADIRRQLTSSLPLSFRNGIIRQWCFRPKVHGKLGVELATGPADETWGWLTH
jgi:hypothetical protein